MNAPLITYQIIISEKQRKLLHEICDGHALANEDDDAFDLAEMLNKLPQDAKNNYEIHDFTV